MRVYNLIRKCEGAIKPARFYFWLLGKTAKCKICLDGYFAPDVGSSTHTYPEYCVFHPDGMITSYCPNPTCENSKRVQLEKKVKDLHACLRDIKMDPKHKLPEDLESRMMWGLKEAEEELAKMHPEYGRPK